MNEVLQQLYARKSVRAFEETEITPQEKQAILQAAFEAPSAGNQQTARSGWTPFPHAAVRRAGPAPETFCLPRRTPALRRRTP